MWNPIVEMVDKLKILLFTVMVFGAFISGAFAIFMFLSLFFYLDGVYRRAPLYYMSTEDVLPYLIEKNWWAWESVALPATISLIICIILIFLMRLFLKYKPQRVVKD